MQTVRAFIAVDIGDEICGNLDEVQRKLKKVHANVRWVNPRSMHLTLVFLGDVPVEELDTIKSVMDQACSAQPAFDLRAAGTGYFGKAKYPRVIWAGIADSPPLSEMQGRLVQELHVRGIEFDNRPFSPHLTLGRVKGIDKHTEPLLQKIEKYRGIEAGRTTIDHVELIQSTLTPRGAEYSVMHRVKLMADSASSEPGGDEAPSFGI